MLNKSELNSLYRYALALTHDEAISYDLVHSAVEKMMGVGFILSKKAYAKKTIKNLFLDRIKNKNQSASEIFEDGIESTADTEKEVNTKLEVANLLAGVDSQLREILFLWAVEEYTTAEIARKLGVPKGTINSKIARLRDRLVKEQGQKLTIEQGL